MGLVSSERQISNIHTGIPPESAGSQKRHPRLTRREFLSKPKTALEAAIVAEDTGAEFRAALLLGDSEPDAESQKLPIKPVFGRHLEGDQFEARLRQLEASFAQDGQLAEIHAWPGETFNNLRALQPSVIALDSLAPGRGYNKWYESDPLSFWYWLPGNPFLLRKDDKDMFLLGGDLTAPIPQIPQDQVEFFRRVLEPEIRRMTKGEKGAFSTITWVSQRMVDLSLASFTNQKHAEADKIEARQTALINRFEIFNGTESAISLLSAIYFLRQMSKKEGPISRRNFNKILGAGIATAGLVNFSRLMAPLLVFRPDSGEYYSQEAYHSLSALFNRVIDPDFNFEPPKNGAAIFRNAIITAKLADVKDYVGEELSNRPLAAVLGTGHAYGPDVFGSEATRDSVLTSNAAEILTLIKDDFLPMAEGTSGPNPRLRETILKSLVDELGGTAIWRIKEAPSRLTPEAFKEQMPLEFTFQSSTIGHLIPEVARGSGFL